MPLSARNEDARHRGRWAMTGAPRVPSRAKLRRGAIPSSRAAVGVAGASRWRLRAALDATKLARFSGGTLARLRLTRTLADVRVAPPHVWKTTCLAGR
jgi:hypothetical protein